ncbi:four helix bundle protein [Fulvivirga lutea]|uniref:Four helix bundle protein n=1 Tax=Fulvivirga lutea TaxID=2810512 RepID=A0A974WGU6_9BACT|nr:four helix bundle protein [Fulvivirga lutea]QSE97448.1 four helix bundle protein [Fulvivirga lutea]
MEKVRKFDLEDRLIDYAVAIIRIIENLPVNKATTHLGGQLLRSTTSPALNYGEVQAAESRKDFVHKMQIVLKELRESNNCLKILTRAGYLNETKILDETNQLISIFVKSLGTAKKNAIK